MLDELDSIGVDKRGEAPTLAPWLGTVLAAWSELSTTRPANMGGAGPIPWTSIAQYAEQYGIEGEDFEDLVAVLREADEAWLKHARRKMDTSTGELGVALKR